MAGLRFLALLLLCPGIAAADAALERRIVTGLNEIWPNEVYELRLEGCRLTVIHESRISGVSRKTQTVWLADWETDPARVNSNRQRITDGQVIWEHVNIWYDLRSEVRADHRDDIERLEVALSHMAREVPMTLAERLSYDLWLRNDTLRMSAEAQEIDRALEEGVYGAFLRRNRIQAEGMTEEGTAFFEIASPIEAPLGFTFRGEVVDGIVADLDAYSQVNCPD